MSREVVEQWYAKLAPVERGQPLVILQGYAYTPDQVLSEVRQNTALGSSLQGVIERRQFTAAEDKYALAVARLRQRLNQVPPTTRLTRQGRVYTPQQLLQEIEQRTPVGQAVVQDELTRMTEVLR